MWKECCGMNSVGGICGKNVVGGMVWLKWCNVGGMVWEK